MFIREQAEDFFNAFKVLKENDEAFITRLSSAARDIPTKGSFGTCPAMGAGVVCLAFSVELYVKSLHYALTRKTPRGHKILKLFKALPEQYQQEVYAHRAIRNYGWTTSNFENEILLISDGFEKWRYSHEFTSSKYNTYFALVFIEAIRATTDRLNRSSSSNHSLHGRAS